MRAAKIVAISIVLLGAIALASGAVAAGRQGRDGADRRAGHGLGLGIRVTDANGNPIEGAQVGIVKLNQDGNKTRSAHGTTSSQGVVAFELRPGAYQINVHSAQGDAQQTIRLQQSQRVHIVIGGDAPARDAPSRGR